MTTNLLTAVRQRMSVITIGAAAWLLAEGGVMAAGLRPETAVGWQAYVAATERRRARELADRGTRFLALDFDPDGEEDRRTALAGRLAVRHVGTITPTGATMTVPSALVHHWRGAVFIPGISVADFMARLEFGNPPRQEDVLRATVLSRSPGFVHVYLRLQRQKIVTVVYNTEHDVTFTRLTATRAASASTATKIAELTAVGTTSERELGPGEDRGFLWKLNAYWRYEAIAGGVLAECESVTLSRSVPAIFSYLVGGLIESTARESMESTLRALRQRYES